MQPQIEAIKQLLKTNNAIAESIDQCIVKWAGESASWEQAATFKTAEEFAHEDNRDGLDPIFKVLWRSRIDLNDVKINAEEVDLEGFLSEALFKDTTEDLINEKAHNENLIKELQLAVSDDNKSQTIQSLQTQVKGYQALCEGYLETQQERDLTISRMEAEIDSLRMDVKERDQRVSLLKTQIKGFEAALELANSKAIAPNLGAFKGAADEAVNPELLEKIAERDRTILELELALKSSVDTQIAKDPEKFKNIADDIMLTKLAERTVKIEERDREINWLESALAFLGRVADDTGLIVSGNGCTELELDLARKENRVFVDSSRNAREYVFMELKKDDRDRQIEELQINAKNHREQFDNLKSHFEVLLKAIAINLNALKGARKPDETKEVNGVMTTFRNYDDNLTHHHKTIIVENVQRAIAEEAKKLRGITLKNFSFDDMPF
jgi:hypothetical protein